ncbi:MAG: hypothetical protein ACTSUN_02420 [Promethearchaeota archaeon]
MVILLIGRGDKLKITSELIDMIKETYEIEKIILVENSKKPRPVVESLIYPSKLISLNEIFLATGDIEFKAIIRKEDQDEIPFTKEELEELIFELTNQITRIEFQ